MGTAAPLRTSARWGLISAVDIFLLSASLCQRLIRLRTLRLLLLPPRTDGSFDAVRTVHLVEEAAEYNLRETPTTGASKIPNT